MLKDQTYLVGRERRHRHATGPERERRSAASTRSRRYIAIPHTTVSRRHAEIIVLNGSIYVRDLGSKNGTFRLRDGHKERLTEGYVDPDELVFFGSCLRKVGKLIEDHQQGRDGSGTPPPGPGHASART